MAYLERIGFSVVRPAFSLASALWHAGELFVTFSTV